MKEQELISISPRVVTEREAVRLVAHHLQLAAMYFEATPIDTKAVVSACARYIGAAPISNPAIVAMRAWMRAIDACYKEMGA